ncbi:MAG: GNAT family N-acetyltransferase/peptidase C39 family protein [Gammaproteobacteria bacterium]|nr:GNAT family N-acetyltransferase/peptidase C39 family protein [Gammaproteobacteria bacterium]
MKQHRTRIAVPGDVRALLQIEQLCFDGDQLSRRSFKHFIKPGSHDLIVLESDDKISGYALVLYRSGTNLARLYSIAILPDQQGKGLSKILLNSVEEFVQKKNCVFIRLEVSVNNKLAISLYEKYGYTYFDTIPAYYDDGSDAVRMEKRLHLVIQDKNKVRPYYEQTTDFTCGPASLMMALKTLDKSYQMSRLEELQIWRESTTIYMTAGHGGCSPHGLALSAWNRGFDVTLHINQADAPFMDSVRSDEKKEVIELVHDSFINQIKSTDIKINIHNLEAAEIDLLLRTGYPIIVLISTWRLNRNKAPHWVYVASSDDDFVYINDPDKNDETHISQTDFIHVPINKAIFSEMAQFGQKKLRCLLVVSGPRKY